MSGHRLAISIADWTGPSVWSSSVSARPSQNCLKLKPVLKTVGALIGPSALSTPTDTRRPSSPPDARSWQLAQDTELSFDSRSSWNSIRPRATLSAWNTPLVGIGLIGSADACMKLANATQAPSTHPAETHCRIRFVMGRQVLHVRPPPPSTGVTIQL